MPDALSGITGALGSLGGAGGAGGMPEWMKLLTLGTGITGTVGNVLGGNLRNQALTQQLALQQKYANMSPADFSNYIQGFTRPLSGALTSGVGNVVQANMAERGLSQAPGIFSSSLAQAIAPFQLQEQQIGTNAAMQSLGLPIEAAARFLPYPQTQDTSQIWRMLLGRYNGMGTGGMGGGITGAPQDPSGYTPGGWLPPPTPPAPPPGPGGDTGFDWSSIGGWG